MSVIKQIRNFLWKILGIDYQHILKVIDYVYLNEDKFTHIGYKSYSNNALVFRWTDSPIIIGKFCSIGDNVRFIVDQGKHNSNAATSYPFPSYPEGEKSGITIGNDVWVGQSSILLPGIKIGNGVTIAAGSIVSKDIPDYCIVAGVPAKILSYKCTIEEASKMNKLAWWDLPQPQLDAMINDLRMPIPLFLAKYDK